MPGSILYTHAGTVYVDTWADDAEAQLTQARARRADVVRLPDGSGGKVSVNPFAVSTVCQVPDDLPTPSVSRATPREPRGRLLG